MAEQLGNLSFFRHVRDLRDMWQGRALEATRGKKLGLVVLSALDHTYGTEALLVMLHAVFPGFGSLQTPFLNSCGKVRKDGAIVADVITKGEALAKNVKIFEHMTDMQDSFRHLADRLRLSDSDRRELFAVVKKWVVCDFRLDPTVDPSDPGARRLVH